MKISPRNVIAEAFAFQVRNLITREFISATSCAMDVLCNGWYALNGTNRDLQLEK